MVEGKTVFANLLRGKTAFGRTSLDACPVAFSKKPALRKSAIEALDRVIPLFGDISSSGLDQRLTRFAEAMLHYANRGGTLVNNPDFVTRVELAAAYLTGAGRVLSITSFGALVSMALTHQATMARRQAKSVRVHEELDLMRRQFSRPPPEPFIAWVSADRHHILHELIHPLHVWEEGVRKNNCLCRLHPSDAHSRLRGDEPAAMLDELGYWRTIQHHGLDVFSLKAGTCTIALMSVLEGEVLEFNLFYANEPRIWDTLADISEYLETRYGAFKLGFARRSPTARMVQNNLIAARQARGLAAFVEKAVSNDAGTVTLPRRAS